MSVQHATFEYGQINDNRELFIKLLRKAHTIVLFHCKEQEVSQIKLIIKKAKIEEDHIFEAKDIIKGQNVRHLVNIQRNIIKKVLKNKSEFHFLIWRDAKTTDLMKNETNLHCDAVYLCIDDYEFLFDSQCSVDNSARITNY